MNFIDAMMRATVNSESGVAPVVVSAYWTITDPHAVSLLFHGGQKVKWYVSREMISEALISGALVGVEGGDVTAEQINDDVLRMTFSSNTGYAEIDFFVEEVAQFIRATEYVTPIGREPGLTDQDLWELLDKESAA